MKKIQLILATIGILTILPTSFATASNNFSDITSQEKYSDAIQFLYSSSIVKGYDDGTFRPENIINRAEMMKIIVEAKLKYNGLSSNFLDNYSNTNCFSDVPTQEWFTKYICYGKEQGWVMGYENGKYFRPSNTISFVEGLKITLEGFNIGYQETSIWYKGPVQTASANNYIPFDIYNFNGDLKRNQMADLITRILKKKEGQSSLDNYLGERKNIIVTYETIDVATDMSKTQPVVIEPVNIEPTAPEPIVIEPKAPEPVVVEPVAPEPKVITNPGTPYAYVNYNSMTDSSFDITIFDNLNDGGKPITSYNVYNTINIKPELFKVLYKANNSANIFTLNNLTKDAEYVFVIKAVNEDGLESPSGDTIGIKVSKSAGIYYTIQLSELTKPNTPILTITDQTEDHITINFTPPTIGTAQYYAVEEYNGNTYVPYKIIHVSDFPGSQVNGPITFSGLTANKEYSMRIRSISTERKWGQQEVLVKFIAQKNGFNQISIQ